MTTEQTPETWTSPRAKREQKIIERRMAFEVICELVDMGAMKEERAAEVFHLWDEAAPEGGDA